MVFDLQDNTVNCKDRRQLSLSEGRQCQTPSSILVHVKRTERVEECMMSRMFT